MKLKQRRGRERNKHENNVKRWLIQLCARHQAKRDCRITNWTLIFDFTKSWQSKWIRWWNRANYLRRAMDLDQPMWTFVLNTATSPSRLFQWKIFRAMREIVFSSSSCVDPFSFLDGQFLFRYLWFLATWLNQKTLVHENFLYDSQHGPHKSRL